MGCLNLKYISRTLHSLHRITKKDNPANKYLSFLTLKLSCAGKHYFSRYYSNQLRKHLSNDYDVLSWYYRNLSFYLSSAWSIMKCENCNFLKMLEIECFFFSIKCTFIFKIQFILKKCQKETLY